MTRYDILDGWYWALSWSHTGQGTRAYARLCRLRNWYHPSRRARCPSSEEAWRVCIDAMITLGVKREAVWGAVVESEPDGPTLVACADALRAHSSLGYTECLCRDCMEGPIMGPGLCDDCQAAGCDPTEECCVMRCECGGAEECYCEEI